MRSDSRINNRNPKILSNQLFRYGLDTSVYTGKLDKLATVTLNCLDCGKEFQTEEVSLMGHMFFQERYCPQCLVIERGTDVLPLTEGRTRLQTISMIKEVTKRNVEPKSGKAPFTLFEIEDGDGTKWTTKDKVMALDAHSLVGRMATINGTIKQNGNYKNYYLEGISEAPAGAEDVFASVSRNGSSEDTFRDTSGEKDVLIWRQTATKVAALLADNPIDFWLNVDLLLDFYRTGVHPRQDGEYATASTFTDPKEDSYSDIPFS